MWKRIEHAEFFIEDNFKSQTKTISKTLTWNKIFSSIMFGQFWQRIKPNDQFKGQLNTFFQRKAPRCCKLQIIKTITGTVFRQRLTRVVTRQRLTHFLKILENFKIPKIFGELRLNPQFLIKIIFGVTLILFWYRIVLILTEKYGFMTLFHKTSFLKSPWNSKLSIIGKKLRENAVQNWHAKDWRIFQALSTIKRRQSLARDCTWTKFQS